MAAVYRAAGEGTEVGPDLLSALRNKTPETLLSDILDPSREVDPRYVNYVVTTRDGRTFQQMMQGARDGLRHGSDGLL